MYVNVCFCKFIFFDGSIKIYFIFYFLQIVDKEVEKCFDVSKCKEKKELIYDICIELIRYRCNVFF